MRRSRDQSPPPPTGQEPMIWKPRTPMIPEADVPVGGNPVLPEPPTKGITVDSEIPLEPGRPRASMPWEPGTPVTEQRRTPRVRTLDRK
jgi:hypothetical protein